MKVRVIQLFSCGVRRPRDGLRADPGTVGNLVVYDRVEANAEGRPLRLADLYDGRMSTGYGPRPLLKPLLDVVLLRITSRGILLRGFEVDTDPEYNRLVVQEWWCSPPND